MTLLHMEPLPELRLHASDGVILEHAQLRSAIKLAKVMHATTPGLQVWTGDAGVGKTVAAEQLALECNAAADAGKPGAYRAQYFLTGGDVDHTSQRFMKKGIYCVYECVVDELSRGELTRRTERALATDIVEQIRLTNLQLLIIDEAGTKNSAEIRGLALIYDIARQHHWPLTLLLVGMDDLAHKVRGLPVLESRVRATRVFHEWSVNECASFLASRSEAIRERLQGGGADVQAAIRLLVAETGGRLRALHTLLAEVDGRLRARASAKLLDVVEDVIDWRAETAERAAAQAAEYRERVRVRRLRPRAQPSATAQSR